MPWDRTRPPNRRFAGLSSRPAPWKTSTSPWWAPNKPSDPPWKPRRNPPASAACSTAPPRPSPSPTRLSGSRWKTRPRRRSAPSGTPACASVSSACARARAQGFFTAGNTGAAMATAKMVLGGLSGVDRPALATVIPTVTSAPTLLLDVGANVDSRPRKPDSVRRHGLHVRAQCAPAAQPACGPAFDRRRRFQGQRADPRHPASAAHADRHQLHRQRRRAATSSTAPRTS